MKTLKGFAKYLRESRLKDYAIYYLASLKEVNLPLMKLAIERGLIEDLDDENAVPATMERQKKALISLEDGSVTTNAKNNLKLWEEGKLLPGLGRNDIQPTDLVLGYAVQKKVLFHFLPEYTNDVNESLTIVQEVEDLYMNLQNDTVQMLFKIQKSTQEQLIKSNERFGLLVQNVKDYAIFSLDLMGNIQTWNEGAQRMQGYTKDEITGKHLSKFYTKDDVQNGVPEYNLKMAREMGHYETQGLRVKKDGTVFWVEAVYTALYDDKGELTGFSKIARDVTAIRNAKVELENKAKELERSNAELEQFAYVASHDLQEPLRTISSYVQLIADRYKDKLDKDANEFIDFTVDGSNRMKLLINSLLEYSRVNKVKPFEWIEPVEIIEDVLQDMKDQVAESGAVIKYTQLPKIYADPVLIGQLFQNLIGNAIKFRDGKTPEIKITGKKEDGAVLFSVKDNGIGIKREYDDKIFIIFQRLNSREKYPGTGIGLSICKKIVERHGGKIWVESEPGKGATFYFTIKTTLL
jgi:PAS domain S-box-containing protein